MNQQPLNPGHEAKCALAFFILFWATMVLA